jgi:hypothetical protein
MTDQNFDKIAQKLKSIELSPLPGRPLVSVLMANYNYARYIAEAIESVLAQTYQHFELIVCDDGSTDNSREVVEQFVSRDSRVRLVSKQNGGLASALNAAYSVSTGEIICLLDSDDLFLPQKIERVVGAFQNSKRAGVCIHRIVKMYNDGRTFGCPVPVVFAEGWVAGGALRGGGIPKNLPSRTTPEASGMSFRRAVTEHLFPLPPCLRRNADGYLLCTAQFIAEICAVRTVLANLRIHGENASSAGEYTVACISQNIEGLKLVVGLTREFLSARYGDAVGQEVRIEDNSLYCSALLVQHILTRGRSRDSAEELPRKWIENIHPRRQRLLARVLLALPPHLSCRALRLWRGLSPAEAVVLRAARSLLRI